MIIKLQYIDPERLEIEEETKRDTWISLEEGSSIDSMGDWGQGWKMRTDQVGRERMRLRNGMR